MKNINRFLILLLIIKLFSITLFGQGIVLERKNEKYILKAYAREVEYKNYSDSSNYYLTKMAKTSIKYIPKYYLNDDEFLQLFQYDLSNLPEDSAFMVISKINEQILYENYKSLDSVVLCSSGVYESIFDLFELSEIEYFKTCPSKSDKIIAIISKLDGSKTISITSDFVLHINGEYYKMNQYVINYLGRNLPYTLRENFGIYYNPYGNSFELGKCIPYNEIDWH